MDRKTLQDVEKALNIAKNNREHLQTLEEMLQQLVTEAKQEERKIADEINAKFADCMASLKSRKRKLEMELVMNTGYYVRDIHGIHVSIIQKRSNLIDAIKTAKEIKARSSLQSCQCLDQVICNLNMSVEEEVLKLGNLKKRTLPRFYMECSEIHSMFENIGKFSYDNPNINEEQFKNDTSSQVNVNLVEEIDVITPSQESDTSLEDTHLQEMGPLSIQKCSAMLPQTASTPDVIIEEIIEDDQETLSAEHPETTYQKTISQKWQVPLGSKTDASEFVIVSYVVNPCHFYVRKVSQKKSAFYLEKTLKQFCHNKSLSPNDILELGTRIFVKSKVHGMWCRAEIIELIPFMNTTEGKPCGPTKYKICEVAILKVFLTDFGHPEALIVSGVPNEVTENPEHVAFQYIVTEDLCLDIRKPDVLMEAQLEGLNKLALQCSLKDIVPKHSTEGWNRRARTEFLKMVNNKAVLMKVFREENGVLIVDLMKPPANKISSDMPVSLRDALVFLDLASFRTELSDQLENTVPLQYCPPVMPQENTEVAIVVSYINSPGDFYIQLLEQGPEFAAFLSKVEEVYKSEVGFSLEILCPTQGQPCVAKFEDDGIWYRAQVIGLPGHQEVEVKYVDFGNTAKISVKEMRKIKDEFLALPAKAIRCKLANIEPCKGSKEWSVQSKGKFEELIQDKCMLCFVTEKSEDDILSVELYERVSVSPKLSSSINSLLVENGLASFVASNTEMITRFQNEIWDPTLEDICKTGRSTTEDLSQMEDLVLECNKELQVRINHVVSPSKIFVYFMSSEKILERLHEKMVATYFGSENETVPWEVGMNCVAYMFGLNQWQRGQILRIVSEKVVEVFLTDLGIIETVDITSLRILEQNLKTVKPLAVECSLTDIRPAGGTEQWTATACDVLARYLTGAVVNLIIQDTNSSPLPVKIFCKDGGHCTDISEFMVKEGLALRKRRAPKTDSSPASFDKQQKNVGINQLLTEQEQTPSLFDPEKYTDSSSTESNHQELEIAVAQPVMVEAYKPPAIPSSDIFNATVSYISDNGTIYVIPKSQEEKLSKLMSDIQDKFKCLGLLEPYSWKIGEACVVRAADTLWYRGEVKEVGTGIIKVRYLDYGYIEKIPQCHLYPTVLYAEIPPFSIPCQLYKTVPAGNVWQQDAVELLQELLTKRTVKIHIMELSDTLWGKVSVKLSFSGISLSSFMAFHKHCITEDVDDCTLKWGIPDDGYEPLEENCDISHEELLMSEVDTPLLPPYSSPSLPVLGELFPVKVTHIVSPNEVYLSIVKSDSASQQKNTEDKAISCGSETLGEALEQCNQNIESVPFLTDFRKDMPCLAEYSDGLWYRAKLLSINEFSPLSILVEFVDYGSTETLPTSRLRQIPPKFMQYPVQAFKVLLAGFKPALCDSASERIPYCPEWSIKALWAMVDSFQEKNIAAFSVTHKPEHTVFLYEDGRLFHLKLVEMGFAELTQ